MLIKTATGGILAWRGLSSFLYHEPPTNQELAEIQGTPSCRLDQFGSLVSLADQPPQFFVVLPRSRVVS